MTDQLFFVTSMPSSRPADYYLGYLEGSVFLDFNRDDEGKIRMVRISFDGYGCCELGEDSIPLNTADSEAFENILHNDMIQQRVLLAIIKKAVRLNKELIWTDALERYHLI